MDKEGDFLMPRPDNVIELRPEETMETKVDTVVVDLGPNNKGKIGPSAVGIESEQLEQLCGDVCQVELRRRAGNIYGCVDGRGWLDSDAPFELQEGEGITQVPGGKAIQDLSIRLMRQRYNGDHPTGPRISKLLKKTTTDAVEGGYTVLVHGDNHSDKEGCGANKNQQAILKSNAENMDTVAPLAWSVCKLKGFDQWIDEDDISQLIVNGKENADDGELWDVTPSKKTDIIVENGGKYVELIDDHLECGAAVTLGDDETVDGRAFARTHQLPDGREIEFFVATLGKAMKDIFQDAKKAGLTEREAALDSAAACLWLLGTAKELGDESLKALLIPALDTSK